MGEDLKDSSFVASIECQRKGQAGAERREEKEVQVQYIAVNVGQWYLEIRQRK